MTNLHENMFCFEITLLDRAQLAAIHQPTVSYSPLNTALHASVTCFKLEDSTGLKLFFLWTYNWFWWLWWHFIPQSWTNPPLPEWRFSVSNWNNNRADFLKTFQLTPSWKEGSFAVSQCRYARFLVTPYQMIYKIYFGSWFVFHFITTWLFFQLFLTVQYYILGW